MVSFRRSSHRAFDRPAINHDATIKREIRDSDFDCPVRQQLRLPVECQVATASAIAGLLFLGGPNAIARFIVSVIIHTFDAVARRWPWPHIFKECPERISPAFADSDSSSTVTVVGEAVGVVAAIKNSLPHQIFSRRRLAVGRVPCNEFFTLDTAAAFLSSHEPIGFCDSLTSALTAAQPSRWLPSHIEQHGQTTEWFPGQIFHAGRDSDRIGRSHDRSPITGVARMARQHQLPGRSHFTTNGDEGRCDAV